MLFPNPTTGKVHIKADKKISNLKIRVLDALGREVNRYSGEFDFYLAGPIGQYLVEIESDEFGKCYRRVQKIE